MSRSFILRCGMTLFIAVIAASSFILSSCDLLEEKNDLSSSNAAVNINSPLTQTVKVLNTQLSGASSMYSAGGTASLWDRTLPTLFSKPVFAAAYGVNWDTTANASVNDPEADSGTVSIKHYMGTQFEESSRRPNGSATNMFGRMFDASAILCGLGMFFPETDSMPARKTSAI